MRPSGRFLSLAYLIAVVVPLLHLVAGVWCVFSDPLKSKIYKPITIRKS